MAKKRPPPPAPRPAARKIVVLVSLALAALVLVVYAPVAGHDFIDLDDYGYVRDNVHVTGGLTGENLRWAWTTGHAANWHPLTWMSHMLDVELFGVAPGRHHLVNVALHLANTLLLFGLLVRMTGAFGRSAFVAALFGLHPLHVESVAWIAERKDVLSTLFWLLTTWAYVEYVRRPGVGRYASVLVLFAAGLLSKPMLVTLPFVLLLLDVWPLVRLRAVKDLVPRVVEKLPLFALAAASSVVTFIVQRQGGAVGSLDVLPWTLRAANAAVSSVAYIGKMLVPTHLAVFYPYPSSIPALWVIGALLLLVGVTIIAVRRLRTSPYVAVGWFWYLGTLVPVIGLVQVGTQAMADRYTYVPLIGLFIVIAWGVPDLLSRWAGSRLLVAATAAIVVLACAATARAQVAHWKNSIALWSHATAVTTENYRAHNSLGALLGNEGRADEAMAHFAEAIRMRPDRSEAHHIYHNLARAQADQGKLDDAIANYRLALELKPEFPEAENNLGLALARQGHYEEAISHYETALRLSPDLAAARSNLARAKNDLGFALWSRGKIAEGIALYTEAMRLKPDLAEAYNNRGFALAAAGKMHEAVADFSEAVRLKPDFEQAHFNLGLAFGALGRYADARRAFNTALALNPANEGTRRALDYLTKREKAGR